MGAAVPAIGLGLQAVSLFGSSGGTQYTPDPKSKYLADLEAIKQAREQATQQEALLRQQTDVANQLAEYQMNQSLKQIELERNFYAQTMQTQYEQGMYQNQVDVLSNEMGNFGQAGQNQLQRFGVQQQFDQGNRQLDLNRNASMMQYQGGQVNRQLQGDAAMGQQALADQSNLLAAQNLGQRDAMTDLKGVGINAQGQQVNLAQDQFLQQQAAANRGLLNQSTASTLQRQQQIGSAEMQRQQAMNQLLSTFLGNEDQANQQMARLQGLGLAGGVQGGQLNQDMNLDPRIMAARQAQQAAYGTQVGTANMADALAQGQLGVEASALRNAGQLQMEGFEQQREGLNRDRGSLAFERGATDLARQQMLLGAEGQRYNTRSFMNQLQAQDAQDYLQNRLLPDLSTDEGRRNLLAQRALSESGIDIAELLRQGQYDLANNQLGTERNALQQNLQTGIDVLDSDVIRQNQAVRAQKDSSRTSNDMALAAALAQLASGQYGLLSSIGAGLSQGVPSGGGGGFNWGGLAGLVQGLAQSGILSRGSSPQQTANTFQYNYQPPANFPAPRTGTVNSLNNRVQNYPVGGF